MLEDIITIEIQEEACTRHRKYANGLWTLPAISIHSDSMLWLQTGVGIEVAVGGGGVAIVPVIHALHPHRLSPHPQPLALTTFTFTWLSLQD